MKRLLCSWLCLLVSAASTLTCMAENSNGISTQLNDEVLGLIVFKSELRDPFSHLASWSEDDDNPCSWKYVLCNGITGTVSELGLDGLGLSGKLGRGLEKLQYLKVLSLSFNNLTGNVSPAFRLSESVEKLNLSHNSLAGLVPSSLVNISSLRLLDLSDNSFTGPISDNMFDKCSSLRYLSLAGNMLEGPIPSTLSSCTLLDYLNLSSNRFAGDPGFSSGIYSMKKLRSLDLSNNVFSSSIPNGISGLHFLRELMLQGNNFAGALPGDLGLCPHLNRIDFSHNMFNGGLPETTQRLISLTTLKISNNQLTGEVPQWISNMVSLEFLELSRNGFTGSLPSSIGEMRSLSVLILSSNKLGGNIPGSLSYCTKLSVLRLRDNCFNGNIPEGLFGLGLKEVDLSNNQLMGSIPQGSGGIFETLSILDLSSNDFHGNIPSEVGLFSNLRYCNLSWNNLQSSMPPELGFSQNLTVLDLRYNRLNGSIPGDVCDSASLGILQLDGNLFSGSIPEEIGNCSSLYLLSLSHNNLTGSIPKSMSKLSNLKILNLEFNELDGEIPQELGRLDTLLSANISYNRLEGRLPVGSIFPHLDKSSLQGNLGLCSPLLIGPCIMNVPKPLMLDPNAFGSQISHNDSDVSSLPKNGHRRSFFSISAIVAISAAFMIVIGVIVITLLNLSTRKRLEFVENALERTCSSSSRSESTPTGKLVLFDSKTSTDWISNPEYLLSKSCEIGEGVFGTVYKVPLGLQGKVVAIKRLVITNIIQYPEDFDREVRMLGKARHPNLIALKGYYWTPPMQLLVTEYAPNGSLQMKLHERLPTAPSVSWDNRFKILLGTAKGLAYLHHSVHPPIIHYNLKPNNILLDEDYNAKISDFGLARLLTELDKHVMSNRFQSALGYVAPELACQSLRVNEKCDVYGFGVMILEVVTGRRPVEYGEDNVVILSDLVRVLLEQGNVLDCVDQSMSEYSEDEILPVLKLAMVCTSQRPSARPSMAEVVQILEVIKVPPTQRMQLF